MIESILNRKKSTVKTPIASISIEILPEYGWSIGPNNERAFGPGTLFKGIKKNYGRINSTGHLHNS